MANANHRNKLNEICEKHALHFQVLDEKLEKMKMKNDENLLLKNKLQSEISKRVERSVEITFGITKRMEECIQIQEKKNLTFETLQISAADSIKPTQRENSTEIIKNATSLLNKLAAKNEPNVMMSEINKYEVIEENNVEKIDTLKEMYEILIDKMPNINSSQYQITDDMKAAIN